MKKAIIFGTASFAEIVHFYLTHDSDYEVVALTVHGDRLDCSERFGLPVVPFEEVLTAYPPEEHELFVAVGYHKVNRTREQVCEEARAIGYKLLTYISSRATVWSERIGSNCFVLEDNTIQPFVTIGDDVIIWSGNHIGHHSTIEDHCYITSHVVISGHCTIGKRTFVGVNATLRDAITVAEDNVIGAGATLLKSTKPGQVFAERTTALYPKKSSELASL